MSSNPPSLPGTGSFHGRSDVEPEILRPAEGYIPTPQPMVRRRRSFWATAPATYVLVGINCAVFLAMVIHGASALGPTAEQLMFWGANNAGVGLEWRPVVAHCDRDVRARRPASPCNQYVVPVEPGAAGRAADRMDRRNRCVRSYRCGGQPALDLFQLVQLSGRKVFAGQDADFRRVLELRARFLELPGR